MHALWGVNKFLSYLCKYISLNWVIEIKWIWHVNCHMSSSNGQKRNKAGYTANTSCGRVGRGENASFHTSRLVFNDGWTDGLTDGPTDKGFYRVVCPQQESCENREKCFFHDSIKKFKKTSKIFWYFNMIFFSCQPESRQIKISKHIQRVFPERGNTPLQGLLDSKSYL